MPYLCIDFIVQIQVCTFPLNDIVLTWDFVAIPDIFCQNLNREMQ